MKEQPQQLLTSRARQFINKIFLRSRNSRHTVECHAWKPTPSCCIVQKAVIHFLTRFPVTLIRLCPWCHFDLEGTETWLGLVWRTIRSLPFPDYENIRSYVFCDDPIRSTCSFSCLVLVTSKPLRASNPNTLIIQNLQTDQPGSFTLQWPPLSDCWLSS